MKIRVSLKCLVNDCRKLEIFTKNNRQCIHLPIMSHKPANFRDEGS